MCCINSCQCIFPLLIEGSPETAGNRRTHVWWCYTNASCRYAKKYIYKQKHGTARLLRRHAFVRRHTDVFVPVYTIDRRRGAQLAQRTARRKSESAARNTRARNVYAGCAQRNAFPIYCNICAKGKSPSVVLVRIYFMRACGRVRLSRCAHICNTKIDWIVLFI